MYWYTFGLLSTPAETCYHYPERPDLSVKLALSQVGGTHWNGFKSPLGHRVNSPESESQYTLSTQIRGYHGFMTTSTLTLTDFLLARIAEDEAAAQKAVDWPYQIIGTPWGATYELVADAEHSRADHWLCVAPTHVLAECEAKRRIVEMYVGPTEDDEGNLYAIGGYGEAWVDAIKFLALPYADHSDYRDEWRP